MYYILRQLQVCYFVASFLMRGWVCNLLLVLVLARAVPLGSESRGTRPYFIVPILETALTWKARSPSFYPPGTGWPRYTPGHWVPYPLPLTALRATMEVFYPAPHGRGSSVLQCSESLQDPPNYLSNECCALITQVWSGWDVKLKQYIQSPFIVSVCHLMN
jgi:hypothetical protein